MGLRDYLGGALVSCFISFHDKVSRPPSPLCASMNLKHLCSWIRKQTKIHFANVLLENGKSLFHVLKSWILKTSTEIINLFWISQLGKLSKQNWNYIYLYLYQWSFNNYVSNSPTKQSAFKTETKQQKYFRHCLEHIFQSRFVIQHSSRLKSYLCINKRSHSD